MSKCIAFAIFALGCLAAVHSLPNSLDFTDKYDNSTSDIWYGNSTSRLLYENLPASPFTNEQIEEWIEIIDRVTEDIKIKGQAIEGLKRLKRSERGPDNSHWCCNKRDPRQIGQRIEVIRARVVQKVIPSGGSVRCGLFGWRRCGSPRQTVVTVTEYYTDYEYPLIPAPEWTNGCPQPNIVCCNGYAFYPTLNNCLTFIQLESILVVVSENQEALFLLNNFLLG